MEHVIWHNPNLSVDKLRLIKSEPLKTLAHNGRNRGSIKRTLGVTGIRVWYENPLHAVCYENIVVVNGEGNRIHVW